MNLDALRKLLTLIESKPPIAQSRAGWLIAPCPLRFWRHDNGTDKNPSFAVKKESGDAFTHCFSCNWSGSLSALAYEIRHNNKQSPALDIDWAEYSALLDELSVSEFVDLTAWGSVEDVYANKVQSREFPQWWLDSFPAWSEVPFARDYLKKRGVTDTVAALLDIRADTHQRRVCFPVRDFNGRLMGLHGRAVDPGVEPRYRMYLQGGKNNPIVWLGESWVHTHKPVVVVEGPMDLASVMRVYRNVVSPLFASPGAEKIKRMLLATEMVIFFDRGKGGDAGRAAFKKTLSKSNVLTFPEVPPHRKDPGEMTVDELKEALAPYVTFDQEI
jgi:5S rRNA maturation endonuclease (ribonuclease M5)